MAYKIERREFIKYACIMGVSTLAGGSLYGCSEKPSKLVVTKDELSEYDIVTYYCGNNSFELALIRQEFSKHKADKGEYIAEILKTDNGSIVTKILTHIVGDITEESAKEKFYNDYNIVKTDSALRVFRSYLGENDYYTIEDIDIVLEEERKCLDQRPQKQLVK